MPKLSILKWERSEGSILDDPCISYYFYLQLLFGALTCVTRWAPTEFWAEGKERNTLTEVHPSGIQVFQGWEFVTIVGWRLVGVTAHPSEGEGEVAVADKDGV